MDTKKPAQVLTIAGTDSGGGAGIQADLKTMQERRVFGTCVVVAVTAQNTLGVTDVAVMPRHIIDHQFAALAEDLDIKAAKTGMLANSAVVDAVVENYQKYDFGPLVVDPVMIAKGGAKLLSDEAIEAVRTRLLPLAYLITPNLPEAEKLAGMPIKNNADAKAAAARLQELGAQNVLIKGGHFSDSAESRDYVLFADGSELELASPRYETSNTHGTGDTISSVIVSEIAKGKSLKQALQIGKAFINAAISDGIQVGHGHGPLNHWAYREVENEI
ncbi:Hydroxymethylpyrimidine phosphate kinase ThiD [Pediococcus acidilactici]|nr:bifunctional hydroxymethylpyrimidine kinase/phosphomethylpyrimidine kinase [Pediococcus acidilactici]MCF4061678.1 bifunctional hydroxymethylpyrimidine kinase/phosphomethylpyrimidine kinase [Pediococcus acidilactici]QDJ23407.1 bifunctional hydroxymethylpyrimidine kinase/phosphomethylpyrimidine kinase [Pediococcus acidilactici]SJM43768.1 Hydroxymethylpyrimidine phosphate kinase ThiD [Pediococcus acidilactici]